MLTIQIKLSPIRDGEKASGSIVTDRKKGDIWSRETSVDFVSGEPSADRTILLEDDQRLIIEGSSNMEIVYDREQNMATMREKPMPAPKLDDPDLSSEKSLADVAAAEYAESQRKAAYEKSQAHQAKLAEEQKAADAAKAAEVPKNIQERGVVMTPQKAATVNPPTQFRSAQTPPKTPESPK